MKVRKIAGVVTYTLFTTNDFPGLPELWTSSVRLITELWSHYERVSNVITTAKIASKEAEAAVGAVKIMVEDRPALVEAFCRASEERIRWQYAAAADDDHAQQEAESVEDFYVRHRTPVSLYL